MKVRKTGILRPAALGQYQPVSILTAQRLLTATSSHSPTGNAVRTFSRPTINIGPITKTPKAAQRSIIESPVGRLTIKNTTGIARPSMNASLYFRSSISSTRPQFEQGSLLSLGGHRPLLKHVIHGRGLRHFVHLGRRKRVIECGFATGRFGSSPAVECITRPVTAYGQKRRSVESY